MEPPCYVIWCPIVDEYISDRWCPELDYHICSMVKHVVSAMHFKTKQDAIKFVQESETMDCEEAPKQRHEDDEASITRVWFVRCEERVVTDVAWVEVDFPIRRSEALSQVLDGTADWL